MIFQVQGDILKSKSPVIAHGVGQNDHFTQGLALSLKSEWPALYKDFRHFCHQENPKQGEMWVWAGANGQRIACLLTQAPSENEGGHPGRANISAVTHCLRNLKDFIIKENPKSIAITKLATGVGGLEWSDVEKVLHQELGSLETPIYLYSTYKKGEVANESTK